MEKVPNKNKIQNIFISLNINFFIHNKRNLPNRKKS